MRLLVSACLLGEKVRYDGKHKRDDYVVDVLGGAFDLVRVCPEADAGLGIPREPMHLAGDPAAPRLVTNRTGRDRTDGVAGWIGPRLDALAALDLDGYVCKKGSPCSGLYRVPVQDGGTPRRGTGLFTGAFRGRFPEVPVEEEGRLGDPVLRDLFLERVFGFRRWKDFRAAGPDRGALVDFHAAHKLQLLAHGRTGYTVLGRLVAGAGDRPWAEVLDAYGAEFLAQLARPAPAGRVADVLQHAVGYFRRVLDDGDRGELAAAVEAFRTGQAPLAVPATLLRHHLRRHEVPWLARQTFLFPGPVERRLRGRV